MRSLLSATRFRSRPTVSLVLPVYNGAKTVRACVASVFEQTLGDFELICIDDVSTDSSRDVLQEIADSDPRVRLIFNEQNIGHGPARNVGIRAARGEFIFHIDPDDTIPKRSLESLYEVAESEGADLVRGAYLQIGGPHDGRIFGRLYAEQRSGLTIWNDPKLRRIPNGHWLGLYRASTFKTVYYPEDINFAYDMLFLTKAFLAAKNVVAIPKVVYNYHFNQNSVMNSSVSWKKVYGDLAWRVKSYELMTAAGLPGAARSRLCSGGDHIMKVLWEPMVKRFGARPIFAFFAHFKSEHERLGVDPWNAKNSERDREVRQAIMLGDFARAMRVIDPTSRPKPFNYLTPRPAPAVSVIIPAFNTAQFIRRCVNSVTNQSFRDLEVVCVNDASPDNTQEILEELQDQDSRIRVVSHQKNWGLTRARNTGVMASRGRYVRHLDSDDFLPPGTIGALYEFAEKNNSEIVRAGGRTMRRGEIQPRKRHHMPYDSDIALTDYASCEALWSFSGSPFYFFRRDFLDKHDLRFTPGVFQHEDYIFLSQALPLAERVSLLHRDCYVYRMLPRKYSPERAIEQCESIQQIVSNLAEFPEQAIYFLNYMRQPYFELMSRAAEVGPKHQAELIQRFRQIYAGIPQDPVVQRLWESSESDEEILLAFEQLARTSSVSLDPDDELAEPVAISASWEPALAVNDAESFG